MSLTPEMPAGDPAACSDEMAQYISIYLAESEEELEELTESILRLEENPHDMEAMHKAFRMLHSLKGSSGMLGFEVVSQFAHELEDRFDHYRSGKAVLNREATTLILQGVDYFRSFLRRLQANDITEGDPSSLLQQIRVMEQSAPVATSVTNDTVPLSGPIAFSGGLTVHVKFRPGMQLADLKARLIVSRLSSIGEILHCEPSLEDLRSFEELSIFSLTILTSRTAEDVRKTACVEGVESIEFLPSLDFQVAPTAPSRSDGEYPLTTVTRFESPSESGTLESPQFPEPSPESTQFILQTPTAPSSVHFVNQPSTLKPSTAKTRTFPVPDAERTDYKTQISETLRVEIGRLNDLMNQIGELVVTNARFSRISENLSPLLRRNTRWKRSPDLGGRLQKRFDQTRQLLRSLGVPPNQQSEIFDGLDDELDSLQHQTDFWQTGGQYLSALSEAVDQLSRVSKNLQRGVLNTRMVSVGPLFNRFRRVVRDLSFERGKQVNLTILGEKTELDKRMIDSLGDPLLHLIRNAIDHGFEGPEDRRARNKPEAGTLTLEAVHSGNNVLITVRDDGGGIQIDRVREKIVARGLASETVVRDLSDGQVIDYIWHPGFSTADAISEISGRGVGMDIVRNAISELNGTIDVVSVHRKGTAFTIRLPLTLAIIHSLLIRYADDYFSIPIDDVREIVSVPIHQVHAVHRHRTIEVRGEMIPLVSMSALFRWNRFPRRDQGESPVHSAGQLQVVVISVRGKTLGLHVDALVGCSDIVIKSLADNYLPVRGLSGAGVLGDGAICLMLDSAALIEFATERGQASGACT